MLEPSTKGATLQENTSVNKELDGSDDQWRQASISIRTDQPELGQLPSDILASLERTHTRPEIQDQSRAGSAPSRSSLEIEQKIDRQSEEAIREHKPTSPVSESNEGLVSSFFTTAKNALSAIIPEPVKEVARSIDRKLSEVLPVWNDIKAWASDAFESICDFFDDLLSENETNSTSDMPSSQSNHVSKKTEVNSQSEQIDAASDKHQSEEEKKMELRKKMEELCYDIFSKKKKEDDLDLDNRLKEAVARMLAAVESKLDRKEQGNVEALSKENNFIVDTSKEKQELLDEAMSRENETSSALMNTFLRELALDDTFRALEPFGFTPEQAEALITAAKTVIGKSNE